MNNIYVDEMPKDCNECPCLNDDIEQGCHCNLGVFDCDDGFKLNKKHPNCPLKPLIAHDKLKDLDYEILKRDYDFLRKEYNRLIDVGNHQLAEERKKVVQEIGQQLGLIIDGQKQPCCDGDMTVDKTIMAVLDQIERGE